MSYIKIEKKIPIVNSYDIVVCGGGPAGLMAAMTASSEGARTALIERYGFLGGMATSAYVTPLSVFSYNGKRNIGGIPWDFIKRLESMGGAYIEQPLNNVAFDPELFKLCAQEMIQEKNVDLYMNSYISGIRCGEDKRISHIFFDNKNGTEAVEAAYVIDATGDADIAFMAGVPMQKWTDTHLQPASMCFILSGVDTDSELVDTFMHHNRQGVNCHVVPVREKLLELSKKIDIPTFGGPWFCTTLHPGSIAVNITRAETDSCDNRDFTKAEAKLRRDVFTFTEILKKNFPEFRNCYIASTPPQAGIRESRHIIGKHVISTEEYISAFKYPDRISRCAHPIDIHSSTTERQGCNFLKEAAYVPYSALITNEHPNLIVAGRSVSASKEAFASLRVQASCMGMGQGAGMAAAIAAGGCRNVQDIDTDILVSKLKKLGAILD